MQGRAAGRWRVMMIRTIIWVILLALHILCCLGVYLGARSHVLKVKKILMPVVVFIPLWGVLCVLLLNLETLIGADQKKEAGIEKLKINEEIYKSIFVNESTLDKEIVPLEEALIINGPKQRRNLIMDVLNDNPEEYIELLQQARLNEDVEVVHYATTAMAELSKEYDLKLQKLERAYEKNPDDAGILDTYCEFLGEYIDRDMVQGQMLVMQRRQYGQLLEKKTKLWRNAGDYENLAENYLKLQDYGAAAEAIAKMEELWPEKECVWLLKLKYYAGQSQGEKIQELIAEIDRRHIYMSGKGKQLLAFWRPKKGLTADEVEGTSI